MLVYLLKIMKKKFLEIPSCESVETYYKNRFDSI